MFRSIVVPLDGSSFGEQALPYAVSIARRSGAQLHLFHVHSLLDATFTEMQVLGVTLDERLREQERQYLEGVIQRLRNTAAEVKLDTGIAEGYVAPTIAQYAKKAAADLIVLTTHARGPLGRFWLGSVADKLVRTLSMPLLLVRPTPKPVDLAQPWSPKTILIPLDGTPIAEQILEPAAELAKLFGAQFVLVRVLRPVTPLVAPIGLGALTEVAGHMVEDIDKIQEGLHREASQYLDRVAQRVREQGIDAQTQIAVADQPGVGVLEDAQALGADLIALETHGRKGLSRMLLGSVADKVIRGATVPVLVQRPASTQ